jgi:hypothetical protein
MPKEDLGLVLWQVVRMMFHSKEGKEAITKRGILLMGCSGDFMIAFCCLFHRIGNAPGLLLAGELVRWSPQST